MVLNTGKIFRKYFFLAKLKTKSVKIITVITKHYLWENKLQDNFSFIKMIRTLISIRVLML